MVKFIFNVEYSNHASRGMPQNQSLDAISIPWDAMRCADMKCTNHSLYRHDIQVFHDTLMESCISACEANIPYASCSKNNYVKPYTKSSLFWHNVWKDCDAPRNAVVADVMRRA